MKPDTFTKLYIHCVFSPKGRASLLQPPVMTLIQKYIYGIINEKKCYPVAINGTSDHLHLLIGLNPCICISDLIRDIKRSSALYINSSGILAQKFSWQAGFGAFTVGYRELDRVYHYILNQELHHSNKNFRTEYKHILDEEGFKDYDKYLFEFYD
jgi:REP element-mobilizing transposase RayT